LDAGCRGGILVRLENFEVATAYLDAPVENKLEN
jgi:hypothetical protein